MKEKVRSGKFHWKRALVGSAVTGSIIFAGVALTGYLGQVEARIMLKSMLPSTRFLCSSVMTASSTILALMFTVLSFTRQVENPLKPDHYDRMKTIALLDVIAFVLSLLLLLVINLPLEESRETLSSHYKTLYYALLTVSSIIGGLLITVIFMLYSAATDVIILVHPQKDSEHLVLQSHTDKDGPEETPRKSREDC